MKEKGAPKSRKKKKADKSAVPASPGPDNRQVETSADILYSEPSARAANLREPGDPCHREAHCPPIETRRERFPQLCEMERAGKTTGQLEVVEGYDAARAHLPIAVEARRSPDAWYALPDNDPLIGTLLQQPGVQTRMLESVIGFDDRTRVPDILSYPWRCICALIITAADGTSWRGTGWVTGRRSIITAGHRVHMSDRGGWVDNIIVIPGADGPWRPFGSAFTTDFRSVAGWVEDQNLGFDYGVIILPEDLSLEPLGRFGFTAMPPDQLPGRMTNIAGYPSDKPANTLWYHARPVREVIGNRITYLVDTAGGQSGAPVWLSEGRDRIVTGIHTVGRPTYNSATLITPDAYHNIANWSAL